METFTTEFSNWTFHDKDGNDIGSDAKEEDIHSFSSNGTEGVQCKIHLLPDEQGWKCRIEGPKHGRFEILSDFPGAKCENTSQILSYFCESSGRFVTFCSGSTWSRTNASHPTEGFTMSSKTSNFGIQQASLEKQKYLYNSIKVAEVDLAKINRAMRASVNGYDIELVAGCEDSDDEGSGARVSAHKAILLDHQFFQDMLNSGMEESVLLSTSSSTDENQRTSLKDDGSAYADSHKKLLPAIKLEMELSTLQAFVNCMYGEEIEFTLNHLGDSDKHSVDSNLCDSRKAWIHGEKYGLDRLRGLAARHIASELTIDTVLGDLVLSKEVVSSALSDIYLAFASMHYQKVLESESFKSVSRELATGTYPAASGDLFSKFILSKGEFTPSPSPSTCYKRNHQSERK